MEFVSKRIDLAINVILLDGTKRSFAAQTPYTSREASKLMDAMAREETDWNLAHSQRDDKGEVVKTTYGTTKIDFSYIDAGDLVDRHLCAVYGTDKGFWLDNVDTGTMSSIKQWIVNELVSIKKN